MTPSPSGRLPSTPNADERWRTSVPSSSKVPGSSSRSSRSRAVSLPAWCWRSIRARAAALQRRRFERPQVCDLLRAARTMIGAMRLGGVLLYGIGHRRSVRCRPIPLPPGKGLPGAALTPLPFREGAGGRSKLYAERNTGHHSGQQRGACLACACLALPMIWECSI